MKIAQYINSMDPGGAESLVVAISNELTARGIENIVIHHGNKWLKENLKCDQTILNSYSIKEIFTKGAVFASILKDLEVTHLHSHLYGATLRGTVAANKAGIPHIATQHDIYTIEEKLSRIFWLKMAEAATNTKLVTVSHQMAKVYRETAERFWFCKFREGSPQVIYNGVDTDKFQMEQKDTTGALWFITVGRLVKLKNHILQIQAIDQLVKEGKNDIRLNIVGEGSERQNLENEIKRRGLEKHIFLLGERDDINFLLNFADVFLLSSVTEGLSCSILEAMACGLPVIASNVGGNSELIQDRVTGWLFPNNNLEALTYQMRDAYNKRYHLKNLKQNIRMMVEEKFSLHKMVDQYINLYQASS